MRVLTFPRSKFTISFPSSHVKNRDNFAILHKSSGRRDTPHKTGTNPGKPGRMVTLVYNECNYAGRARKIYSCQFPHIGSFDLFRPNEAFYKVLTSAYIDGLRGRQRHYYRYMVQL